MKRLLLFMAAAFSLSAQQTIHWTATTGSVSQSGSTYTATIQQPATNQQRVLINKILVYCSVACTVTQSANGTAATSTAGTISLTLPSLPTDAMPTATFWTASNAGTGSPQGGITYVPAGGQVVLCTSPSGACVNQPQIILVGNGTAANYSVTISAITGTSNIWFDCFSQ